MPASPTASRKSTDTDHNASPLSSRIRLDASSIHCQAQREKTAASSGNILIFLICFRILNALCVRTFFQPDEYFQSLEPAWSIAFGEGKGAWLTWEWKHHLRSTLHPYLFATGYWIAGILANLLQLKPSLRADILIVVPKVIQAHIAALGDYYTWKLAERVYGRRSLEAWACLALTVSSPWQWFCSTRTLSNSLETTLTVIALCFWPWEWSLQSPDNESIAKRTRVKQHAEELIPEQPPRIRTCLVLAAVACILRPTNILVWAFLACSTLFRITRYEKVVPRKWPAISELLNATSRERAILLKQAALCGTGVLLVSVLFDWSFYRQLTFPPFKFLYFNIAKSLAVFYGRNDWHYYLSQGYPLLLTTFLPFAAIGLYKALSGADTVDEQEEDEERLGAAIRYQLASISLIIPFILSFIAHKEVRFIYPILPLLHVLSASSAAACIRPLLDTISPTRTTTPISSLASSPASSVILKQPRVSPHHSRSHNSQAAYRYSILFIILLVNLLIAIFTTQYHQRGVLSVMNYLRREHETHYLSQHPAIVHLQPSDATMTVGFLMPCHSTPWRSHLVYPSIHAWALGCEPPVDIPPGKLRDAYRDEADRFYDNPRQFLQSEIGSLIDPTSRKHFGLAEVTIRASKSSSSYLTQTTITPPEPSVSALQSQTSDRNLTPWNGGLGRKPWPEYLVFFEGVMDDVVIAAGSMGYSRCWRGWNSWFHDDWRRRGDIIVFCRPRGGV